MSKLRCMSILCPYNDTDKERNCQNWRPHEQCGFKDKATVKVVKVLPILERKMGPTPEDELNLKQRTWNLITEDQRVRKMSYYNLPDTGSAFAEQVGGDHYKKMAIQPTEYCQKNGLNTCESNIVKYASRHKFKNGREDVLKIIHYAEILLELEYPDDA